MIGHNEGYIEGRKNAHIPAKELGLPNSMDYSQEWSEEDEKILNELLDHCNTENATWYNWLKSLRPPFKDRKMKLKILKYLSTRCSSLEFEEVEDYLNNLCSSWKPSEEQLEAVRYVSQFDYGGHKTVLVSLYEQLKKLM